MKHRLFGAAAMLSLTTLVGGGALATSASAAPTKVAAPVQASAPHTGSITSQIPCTVGGVADTCTLTVTAFRVVNGVLTAVGTVTGGGVTVPFQAPVQAAGSCRVLDLTLGPLDLDPLGLVVDLNQVHLNITAQQGPGNLLNRILAA